ncbi:MAG: hypothetical protein AAF553_00415 [Pseudomonadota bacterium]
MTMYYNDLDKRADIIEDLTFNDIEFVDGAVAPIVIVAGIALVGTLATAGAALVGTLSTDDCTTTTTTTTNGNTHTVTESTVCN